MKSVAQRLFLALAASLIFALAGCDSRSKTNGPPVVQPQAPDPSDPVTSDAKAKALVLPKAPQ